ncbi:MAG: plastocyanin [Granulosicoccus sp.]|jgi:plastocyanin
MKTYLSYFALILIMSSAIYASASHAASLRILEKNGEALENAVVLLPSIAAQTMPEPAIMDQIKQQYSPHVLAVTSGQEVSFPNRDNIRHHVYSFSKTKSFEIKLYSGTEASQILFDSPSIVVLACNVHDSMMGYILVSDGQWSVLSDANGITVQPALAEVTPVTIWHSQMSDNSSPLHQTILTTAQLSQSDTLSGAIDIALDLLPIAPKKANSFKSRFTRDD